VIELITEIEDHFRIRFSEAHFQERRFSTIGGLGALIGELRSGQG
jgi:acyl carrier protein